MSNQKAAPEKPTSVERKAVVVENRLAYFKGGNNYRSPDDHFPYGGYRGTGIVEVIGENKDAKHQFRIRPVRGTQASGWVDASTLSFDIQFLKRR